MTNKMDGKEGTIMRPVPQESGREEMSDFSLESIRKKLSELDELLSLAFAKVHSIEQEIQVLKRGGLYNEETMKLLEDNLATAYTAYDEISVGIGNYNVRLEGILARLPDEGNMSIKKEPSQN